MALNTVENSQHTPVAIQSRRINFLRTTTLFSGLARLHSAHVTDAALLAASSLLMNVISVPTTAYIVRQLGPESYGEFAISLSLILATGFITNLGLRGYFVRAVAQSPAEAQSLLAEQLGVRIVLGAAAGLVAMVLCIGLGYSHVVIWCTAIASVGMVATTVSTTVADLLQALQRMRVVATIMLIAGLSLTLASIAVIWQGSGPIGLATAYLVGPALSTALSIWFVGRKLFPVLFSFGAWHVLWRARYLGVQSIIAGVSGQMESLLLPKLAGITVFGFFNAGTLLPTRLWVVPDALETVYYPVLAKSYQDDLSQFRRTFWRFTGLSTILCVAIAAILTLTAEYISQLLFPGKSDTCRQIIQLTAWSLPLNAIALAMRCAVNAAGHESAEARVVVWDKTICIVAAAVLVWQFGLIGACWSILVRGVVGIATRLKITLSALRPST